MRPDALSRRIWCWFSPRRIGARRRSLFTVAWWLVLANALAAQNSRADPPRGSDAEACAALADVSLENAPGGPALVTSARLVAVPASGLERWILAPSGYSRATPTDAAQLHQYCDVTGYVAPQNKFELKLPLPRD